MSVACQPKFFNEVCRRYASILQDLPGTTVKELEAFLEWAHKKAFRWSLLREGELSLKWKQKLLESFYTESACSDTTKRTLATLNSHNRIHFLPDILQLIHQTKKSEKIVYLTVPKKLSTQSLSHLSQKLSEIWKTKVVIHQSEDRSLLLGGIFLWDHFMLDASLSSLLSTLKKETLHAIFHS